MGTKSERHIIDRARQRYGIELSEADIMDLRRKLKDGKSVLLGNAANGCERRAVDHNGKALVVVWEPSRRFIYTVLPRRRSEGIRTRFSAAAMRRYTRRKARKAKHG